MSLVPPVFEGVRPMLPIKTVLHATDFSQASTYAWEFACALAHDYRARLILLHVTEIPQMTRGNLEADRLEESHAAAQAQLEQLGVPHQDVAVERRLARGDAADQILTVARQVHADLLVVGSHGRTGLNRLLMGSVAEAVVRESPCPVITVKVPERKSDSTDEVSEAVREGLSVPHA